MDETRALLDALMGPNRNAKADKASGGTDFLDKSICKHFLVGFCPHDWFTLQKRQLRPCHKLHSDMMKANFEAHPDSSKYRIEWEEDFLNYLEGVVRECDSFISREKPKCRPKGAKVVRVPQEAQARLEEKEKHYADLIKKSEELESSAYMVEANALKEDIDGIKEKYTFEFPGEDICDVCGVRYPCGAGWEGHDKDSHKRGKMHDGFEKIRAKVEELRGNKRDWEKMREKHKDWFRAQRKQRDKEAERERELEKTREKEKEAEREKEREKEKEREREQAAREKERTERERAKEKEKKGREKDKDRDRDRDRARRDRSRSRGDTRASPSVGRKRKDKKEKDDDKKDRDRERRSDAADAPPPPGPPPPAPVVGQDLFEKDLLHFWEHLTQLTSDGRLAALKNLNLSSRDRLELWLVARIAARPKAL